MNLIRDSKEEKNQGYLLSDFNNLSASTIIFQVWEDQGGGKPNLTW